MTDSTKLPTGWTRYEPGQYLENREDIAEYLTAMAEECADEPWGPEMLLEALRIAASAKSRNALAEETGLSRDTIRKALKPGSNPTLATVSKLAASLGGRLTYLPLEQAAHD